MTSCTTTIIRLTQQADAAIIRCQVTGLKSECFKHIRRFNHWLPVWLTQLGLFLGAFFVLFISCLLPSALVHQNSEATATGTNQILFPVSIEVSKEAIRTPNAVEGLISTTSVITISSKGITPV